MSEHTWDTQLRPGSCGMAMLEQAKAAPYFSKEVLYNIATDKDGYLQTRALAAKLYVAESRLGFLSAGVSAHDPDRERSDSHRGDSSKPCSTVAADRDPEVATPDAARLRQIRERFTVKHAQYPGGFNLECSHLELRALFDLLDAQASELRTLRADQEDLRRWRSWAQFVWKGGGPISGTDDELRKAICEQFDELRAASPAPQEPQG